MLEGNIENAYSMQRFKAGVLNIVCWWAILPTLDIKQGPNIANM